MKRLTSILAAALSLAACAPSADSAQKFRDAIPPSEAVQLRAPAADGTAAPTALVASGALASTAVTSAPPYPQSEFATISYWSAFGINGGTWWTLKLVEFVTSHKPTDCNDDACTWGPWRDDEQLNDWKLTVTETNGAYDWAFYAQNAAVPGPWVTLISGRAVRGVDRHHGSGNFLIDFDAQDALSHGPGWTKTDHGTVEITYDNTAGSFITAAARGGVSSDPADLGDLIDANYSFAKPGAGGQIQIAILNRTANEAVKLNTRWQTGGAGRGDALWSSDGGATWVPATNPPFLTECWDGAAAATPWGEVFDNTAPDASGVESNCVFAAGEAPTIALP